MLVRADTQEWDDVHSAVFFQWPKEVLEKALDRALAAGGWEGRDGSFRHAISQAAGLDRQECLAVLLSRWEGPAPAHAAELGELSEGVVRLLLEAGADPDARDRDGNPALHMAARQGNAGNVRLLLDHGAHVVLKDSEGRFADEVAMGADLAGGIRAVREGFSLGSAVAAAGRRAGPGTAL